MISTSHSWFGVADTALFTAEQQLQPKV